MTADRPTRDGERPGVSQLCPKCNGTGLMSRPSYVAGDQQTWTAPTAGPYRCNLCDGRMVIDVSAAAVAARPAGRDEETLRRPDEWCRIKSVRVLDPDGWRDDDAPSWIEPITEAEFDRRLSRCTQGPWDWETNQPRRPSSPSSPVPDEELREEIARALYRAKWHDMLVWEKAGAAAQMQWRARADAVLSLPSLRRLLDTAAAVERVRDLLALTPNDRTVYRSALLIALHGSAEEALRRALDGSQ